MKKYFKNAMLLYAFISVPLGLFFSFFLALALSTKLRGVKCFRALFYLPVILPAVASGVLITDLFSYTYGIYNRILMAFGLPRFTFFTSEKTAMFSPKLITKSPKSKAAARFGRCFTSRSL